MSLSATRKAAKKAKKVEAAVAKAEEEKRRLAATRLCEWATEANRRANSLEPGVLVWRMVDDYGGEALNLGVYRELRDIVWVAAGKVADPRGLRVTRCHRRGREVEDENGG